MGALEDRINAEARRDEEARESARLAALEGQQRALALGTELVAEFYSLALGRDLLPARSLYRRIEVSVPSYREQLMGMGTRKEMVKYDELVSERTTSLEVEVWALYAERLYLDRSFQLWSPSKRRWEQEDTVLKPSWFWPAKASTETRTYVEKSWEPSPAYAMEYHLGYSDSDSGDTIRYTLEDLLNRYLKGS